MCQWTELKADLVFRNNLDSYSLDFLQDSKIVLEKSINIRNEAYKIMENFYQKTLGSGKKIPMKIIYRMEQSIRYMQYHGSVESYQLQGLEEELLRRQ